MNRIVSVVMLVICLVVLTADPVRSDEYQMSVSEIKTLLEGMGAPPGAFSQALSAVLHKALRDPETFDKLVNKIVKGESGWRFLRDLNIEFKVYRDDDNDSPTSLGFEYSYAKDLKRSLLKEGEAWQLGLNLSVDAEGNVAFDRGTNPTDFVNADVSFHMFHSICGAIIASDEQAQLLNDLEDELVEIEDPEELNQSPLWSEFLGIVGSHLTSQFYYDVSLAAGLEADQSFIQKQYVYGGRLGVSFKAWSRESRWASWNVFDWPFAAIRYLNASDRKFSPRGSSFPTVLIRMDYVDPDVDYTRGAVGDASGYSRFGAEIAFKTSIGKMSGKPVYFIADARYFKELSPSLPVWRADLDEHAYFVATLSSPGGMYIAYTTGRMPFDAQDDRVYELGFSIDF